MQNVRSLRTRILSVALFASLPFAAAPRAHAASKEIIELQTQVQTLLDQVQRLQSTLDAKFGVLQHLVEQSTDNVNRMSAAVDTLQQKVAAQNEALSGKVDTAAGQVQSVNDAMEELKSRMSKLDQTMQSMQSQLQNLQAQPSSQSGAQPSGQGSGQGSGFSSPGSGSSPSGNAAPPLQDTYEAGVRDFNAAKYDVAAGEFGDVIQYYPEDDLAGNAAFYLGEISYRQQNWGDAIKAYTAMLEKFPNASKVPAAQLHKGLSLLQLNKKQAGVQELRTLIQKHPQTPEALTARSKLNGMGIKPSPAQPAH
jgi:tol-pal system protein YbgF